MTINPQALQLLKLLSNTNLEKEIKVGLPNGQFVPLSKIYDTGDAIVLSAELDIPKTYQEIRNQKSQVGFYHEFDSTALSSMIYYSLSKRLIITFHNSGSYECLDVPLDIAEGLRDSYSAGAYYGHVIKGRYVCNPIFD